MKKSLLIQTTTALLVAVMVFTGCKKDPVKISGVTLNKTTLELIEGGSETLTATITPADAENKAITWSSSDVAVATVDAAGKITAVKAGTATITVTTADGGKTTMCIVTVQAANEPANTITMTTVISGQAEITLAGTGTATIDWGDGTASQAATLTSTLTTFSHTWAGDATTHNIAIYGQNITHLICQNLQLTAIDVTKNTALIQLVCGGNRLTDLDVTKNTALKGLSFYNNQLTALDVGQNTALIRLECHNNQLTALDVSRNTALMVLICAEDQLTALDVSKSTTLTDLVCHNNQFTAEELNALFGTLHGNTSNFNKRISIADNPGTAGCNQSIATAKGWSVNTTPQQ